VERSDNPYCHIKRLPNFEPFLKRIILQSKMQTLTCLLLYSATAVVTDNGAAEQSNIISSTTGSWIMLKPLKICKTIKETKGRAMHLTTPRTANIFLHEDWDENFGLRAYNWELGRSGLNSKINAPMVVKILHIILKEK